MNMTGQDTNPWVVAAQAVAPTHTPVPTSAATPQDVARPVDTPQAATTLFLAAHGGAGATVWASALDGRDGGLVSSWVREDAPRGCVVLVLRCSVDGITSAKKAIAQHGADAFTCLLAVAAAPGRTPRRINDELKVLGGAVPLAHAPWIPTLILRRAALVTASDIPPKELNRITTELTKAGLTLEGETK